MVGPADSVLIREVSFIQSVLYREVPMTFLALHMGCAVSVSPFYLSLFRVLAGNGITKMDSDAFIGLGALQFL